MPRISRIYVAHPGFSKKELPFVEKDTATEIREKAAANPEKDLEKDLEGNWDGQKMGVTLLSLQVLFLFLSLPPIFWALWILPHALIPFALGRRLRSWLLVVLLPSLVICWPSFGPNKKGGWLGIQPYDVWVGHPPR